MHAGFLIRGNVSSDVVRDLIARVGPSLAEVVVKTPGGWRANGSAFAVSTDGLFATCQHVLANSGAWQIHFGGKHWPASLVTQRDSIDMALLKVETVTPALSLGSVREVHVGDEVLWGGYPAGSPLPSWHKGMVSYLGELPSGSRPTGIQLDGTVNSGNSGGPILNPHTSAVIGVVTSKLGGLDDRLSESLSRLRFVSQRTGMMMVVNGIQVSPEKVLIETIEELRRIVQLGVGFGISAEYLASLKDAVAH